HRIWSTDWFQRPNPVLNDLLTKLESLKNAPQTSIVHPIPENAVASAPDVTTPEPAKTVDPQGGNNPRPEQADQLPPGTVPYNHERNAPKIGNVDTLFKLPLNQ